MTMKLISSLILVTATLFLQPASSAQAQNLIASKSDAELNALPGVQTTTSSTARVGLTSSNGFGRAGVFVLEYPKIAFGEKIADANFTVNLKTLTGSGFNFNGDLYSLGTGWNSTVLASDYYNGPFASSPTATGVQDNFLVPSTPVGSVTTSATGRAALASDLEAERRAGAAVGLDYFLRLNPDFSTPTNTIAGYNVSLAEDSAFKPTLNVTTRQLPQKGRALIEYWTGIPGATLNDLLVAANYPQKPSHRELPMALEVPQGLGADCGSRVRTYFYPPVGGNYVFALAGGDSAELLLSTDDQPSHATVIASLPAASGFRVWNAYPQQTSAPLSLQSGTRYYLEARQKQGAGGGSLSIGSIPPGQSAVQLMGTADCEPFDVRSDYSGYANVQAIMTQSHPRLMLSPAAILRLKELVAVPGSTPAAWYAAIKSRGETMLTAAYPSNANDPRPTQHAVYHLGLLYLLSEDSSKKAQYKTRIYNELTNSISWGDWAPSEFLALGEAANTFAIAYDWLYNDWSPTERSTILAAIRDQALSPALTQYAANAWWVKDQFNWSIVVNGGIAMSALAILGDDNTTAPAALDNSIGALRDGLAIANLGPDGAGHESHNYWNFSVRYLSALFASTETAAATCFNLDTKSGGSSIGSFPVYNTGPFKKVFNFADHPDDTIPQTWGSQFLALKYNQPVYAWLEKQVAGPYPLDLVWYDPRTDTPATLGLPASTYFRNAGVVTLRDHWNDTNSLFLALKSGYNAFNGHSQLELGSFVFDALGIRWVADLGRENTSLPNFYTTNPAVSPNRWLYYRNRAEGNNTLVINPSSGHDQLLTGTTSILRFSGQPENPSVTLDLTSAYSDKVSGLTRGVRFLNGVVQLQDELVTATAVDLNWFMHTATSVALSGDAKSATLTSGTKHVEVRIQSPASATFTLMAAEPLPTSPNPSGLASNAGYQKLRIRLPATTSTTLTVAYLPYADGSPVPAAPPLTTLANWGGADVASTRPTAPMGLTATPGNAQVVLTWTAVPGATSYNIKRTYAVGSPYTPVALRATGTSFTDTGLTNGSTYYYVVSAINASDEGANSASVSATPYAPPVPAAPTGLTASPGNAVVTLNWNPVSGANSYIIKVGSVTGGPYTPIASGITTTTYNYSGLTNGTSYYFTVAAVNSGGEGPSSSQASVTPSANGALPLAPVAVTAIGGDTQVVIAWPTQAGATGYNVKRASTRGGPYTAIATGLGTTSYSNTGLTNGVAYYYVVSALNEFGEGADSLPTTATPGTSSAVIAVSDVYVRNGTYAATNYGTDTTLIVKLDATSFEREAFLKFNVAGLANAQSVTLRLVPTFVDQVAATLNCEVVADDNWNTSSLTWNNKPASSGILAGQLTSLSSNVPKTLDLTAQVRAEAAGDGVLSLRIYSTTAGSTAGVILASSRQSNASLRPQLVIVLGAPAPPAPTALAATPVSPYEASLSWSTSSGATAYVVKRGLDADGPFSVVASALTGTSFTDTSVIPGATYFYVVVASNSGGSSGNSAPSSVTLPKAPATIVLTDLNPTYNGTPQKPTATTSPAGLTVLFTYNENTSAPVDAGSYVVVAAITDPSYTGAATDTLTIAKASASLALDALTATYDGNSKSVSVTTTPAGLNATVTYDGSSTPPINPGAYAVVATIDDPNYVGSATGTLAIGITGLVRHAPTLNGHLTGSVQMLLPESLTLNSSAVVSGDFLVPGTPTIVAGTSSNYGGTLDGIGAASPSDYTFTLNSGAVLRHVVRRTAAIALPIVTAPPAPSGTRNVAISSAGQSIGEFVTLCNLTLYSSVGQVAIPPGTYGSFSANSGSGFILGIPGATQPAIYNLQGLTLNSGSQLQILGPTIINLAAGPTINTSIGESTHPEWLIVNAASGSITVNSNKVINGHLIAPGGTITVNGILNGSAASDRLTVSSAGALNQDL